MNERSYFGVISALAAALLAACSKSERHEVGAADRDTAELAAASSSQPKPQDVASVGELARAEAPSSPSSVRALALDFYQPCDGKKAGDDCVLNFAGRDVKSRCVAEPDQSGAMRLSCGPRRPSSASGSSTVGPGVVDSYSPCAGKKAGDECAMKMTGGGEARSHCYASSDVGKDERLSCGPRPTPNREK